MWAQYSEIGFPIVQVQMKGKIKNDEDFYDFTNGWLEYYKKKQDFVFVFDTTDVGFVNIKYAFKMANFVKELKKQEIQYLKHSIIVTDNWWTKFLLKIIFAIQSPVCSIEYHSDFENLDLENLILKTKGRDSLGLQ
jgi:hypothetical protein|tara:strand:+ start:208 stop:615 length:408 start_codon:yes stop_codon:yes gene_type:complete